MKTHTINPFSCSQCGKAFKRKQLLEKHLKCHEYQCSHCASAFTTKDLLQLHLETHEQENALNFQDEHKEKPFACNNCHLTFSQKKTT